jgi:hypothetical protein
VHLLSRQAGAVVAFQGNGQHIRQCGGERELRDMEMSGVFDMTPTRLRHLANLVASGRGSNKVVRAACGWRPIVDGMHRSPIGDVVHHNDLPEPLTSIDAAAGLLPEGWYLMLTTPRGRVNAWVIRHDDDSMADGITISAPTEPKARTAAALLARAAEAEADCPAKEQKP